MDSTAGLRNLPERGDQSREGGEVAVVTPLVVKNPGVLCLKPQSGGRKSCRQCVAPSSALLPGPCSSWAHGREICTYLLVFVGSASQDLTWAPDLSESVGDLTGHARPGCPQQAHGSPS